MEPSNPKFNPPSTGAHPGFVTAAFRALDEIRGPIHSGVWKARIGAIRLFNEVFGDVPVHQVSKSHAADFVKFLQRLPSDHYKRRSPIVVQSGASCALGDDEKLLSTKTIEQHLYSLAWLWETVLCKEDVVPQVNPFRGHILPRPERKRSEGLSQREVERVFSVPLFTSGERPVAGLGELCFWLPHLVLWTGVAPGELADLRVADFMPAGRGKEATIAFQGHLAVEGQNENLRGGELIQARIRTVPIARRLLELNLLDYVSWLETRGENMLFPEFHSKRSCKEQLERFAHWWSGYLRQHGAHRHIPKPLRELSKTWLVEADRRGVSKEAQRYIVGQADPSRMRAPELMAELGREIHKISFTGWDFGRVQSWRPPSISLAHQSQT